jgi:hypothetical protein
MTVCACAPAAASTAASKIHFDMVSPSSEA